MNMDDQILAFWGGPPPMPLPTLQLQDPGTERETEGMDDLFALVVDEAQLASEGLEVLFDIAGPPRGQDENARGSTPETTPPGLSAGPSTAAQTPRDGSDVDGIDLSQASDGAAEDPDASATPRAKEGLAEARYLCSLINANSDAVHGVQTSNARRQTASMLLDWPLPHGRQFRSAGGVEAPPDSSGTRKRRAEGSDCEAGYAREAQKRQRVGESSRRTAVSTFQHTSMLLEDTAVPVPSHGHERELDPAIEYPTDVELAIPSLTLEPVSPRRAPGRPAHGAGYQTTHGDDLGDMTVDEQSEADPLDVDLPQAVGSASRDTGAALPFDTEDHQDWAEQDDDNDAVLEDNTPPPAKKSTRRGKKKAAQRGTKKTSNASVSGQNTPKHDTTRTRTYFAYTALWEERAAQVKQAAEALLALPPDTPVAELPGKKTLSDEDKERLKQLGPLAKGRVIPDTEVDYVTCNECIGAFSLDDERILNKEWALTRHKKEYHAGAACSACGMPIVGRDVKHFRMHRETCEPLHSLVRRGCHWEWMMHHQLVNPRITKEAKSDEFFDFKQKVAANHADDAYAALRDMFEEREVKAIRKKLRLAVDGNA